MDDFEAHRKRRISTHLQEDTSYKIIRNILPEHWVIRDFNKPDYGIDLVVELFQEIDEYKKVYETLGEYIFIQVKSIENPIVVRKKFYPVQNVAKFTYQEDKEYFVEVDVIKFPIDTNELITVQGMGASVSVMLFIVVPNGEKLYFVNLNDLIDKVIIPQQANFHTQKTLTIEVPLLNEINRKRDYSFEPLKFYAKRAKMLAAFSTFLYQHNEINYALKAFNPNFFSERVKWSIEENPTDMELTVMIKSFILQIEELDIWDVVNYKSIRKEVYKGIWEPLKNYHEKLRGLSDKIKTTGFDSKVDKNDVLILWFWLGNLNNLYQEVCREWWLPKFLGLISSYPKPPKIHSG